MKYSKIYSAQVNGSAAEIITIETDISNGLHSFSIVGMGDKTVRESRDRVASAIKNSGFLSPKQKNQKVVVSLSPASTRKEGSIFDLAIALAYLSATGDMLPVSPHQIFLGELSLDGRPRYTQGVLALLLHLRDRHFKEAFVPRANLMEVQMVDGIVIRPVNNLKEVIDHFNGKKEILAMQVQRKTSARAAIANEDMPDMSLIRGQEHAKRALEIAAIGRHNLLMSGPPGIGKTMLAQAFAGILPDLSKDETLEVTALHTITRGSRCGIIVRPPFRSPHHTSSYAALLGGGTPIRAGEVALAHRGVLFLDELPEFDRRTIEALRQPIEEKKVTITRLHGNAIYPADIILVAAMNPCPCGYGDARCVCSEPERRQYQTKISGAIIDRIDMFIHIKRVGSDVMSPSKSKIILESSATIRDRVEKVREFQKKRMEKDMDMETERMLISVSEKLGMSGRAFERTLRVARSIADLSFSPTIKKEHLLEALQYRSR